MTPNRTDKKGQEALDGLVALGKILPSARLLRLGLGNSAPKTELWCYPSCWCSGTFRSMKATMLMRQGVQHVSHPKGHQITHRDGQRDDHRDHGAPP